jgi:hypothetical protein
MIQISAGTEENKKGLNMIVKKSCKIPRGGNQNPSVNRRKTENTMTKGKRGKGQTTINTTYIYVNCFIRTFV